MLILAVDTTTRAGSVGVFEGDTPLALEPGDPAITYGERLHGDIRRLLDRAGVRLHAIDLFAVATGPGSFTGLRVGIATMQGLALSLGKGLVGVSLLDALALAAQASLGPAAADRATAGAAVASGTIGVWIDAQREEVFAAAYRAADRTRLDGPLVGTPEAIWRRWETRWPEGPLWLVGDGATRHRPSAASVTLIEPTPVAAAPIAWLARQAAAAGPVAPPDAIRPLYVRRPDAELARARREAAAPQSGAAAGEVP